MNIWKKILGISLAVGLSVSMGIVPIYADSISILDEITDEETTEDYSEDTSTILARSSSIRYILPCAWIPCSQSVRYKRIYLYADAGYHGQIMTIGKEKGRKILFSNP